MLYSVKMRADDGERHICGAEGIYSETQIYETQTLYLKRAINHPRGKAKKINITIAELPLPPKEIKSLPVSTCDIKDTSAKDIIFTLLKALKCSNIAINKAMEIIFNQTSLRGAAIIDPKIGQRLDSNSTRGIRASMFGLSDDALSVLNQNIETFGLIDTRVKEGLEIASKIASCNEVLAELCVSDNPDYTTGYVASRKYGYVRIPFIKESGSYCGGRVIFIKHDIKDIKGILTYLENTPVMITEISGFRGRIEVNEIICASNSQS